MQERLQKILSARGICSRRKAEEYILAGFVKVNGRVAELGQKADPLSDKIEVDGKVLNDRTDMLYEVMNKPEGVESTNVPCSLFLVPRSVEQKQGTRNKEQGTKTVWDVLPPHLRGKVFPVGRLDKDSSGLLIFTNDGVLAYRLTHPSFNHEKEYEVTTAQPISPSVCRKIEEGFEMDGSKTKPLKCWKVATTRARVILTEGKNRQIRRMFQQTGYTVKQLKRVRIMTLYDDSMEVGALRPLTPTEKEQLLKSVGIGRPEKNEESGIKN